MVVTVTRRQLLRLSENILKILVAYWFLLQKCMVLKQCSFYVACLHKETMTFYENVYEVVRQHKLRFRMMMFLVNMIEFSLVCSHLLHS